MNWDTSCFYLSALYVVGSGQLEIKNLKFWGRKKDWWWWNWSPVKTAVRGFPSVNQTWDAASADQSEALNSELLLFNLRDIH